MLTPPKLAFARYEAAIAISGEHRMKNQDIGDLFGVTRRTIQRWVDDPQIGAEIERRVNLAHNSKDYYKAVMRDAAMSDLFQQYSKSSGAERRHLLAMVLKETDEIEIGQTTPFEDMSDDDLMRIIEGREVSVYGMTPTELRKVLGVCRMRDSSSQASSSEPDSTTSPSPEDGQDGTTPDSAPESGPSPCEA